MKKSNKKTLSLLGMSPGNGYFKAEIVEKIIDNLLGRDKYIAVFIPDIPAVSTYMAIGYPLSRSIVKAKKAGSSLRSKARRSLEKYPDDIRDSVCIIDWENDVQENDLYLDSHKKILELFKSSSDFRIEVLESTKSVLEKSGRKLDKLESSLLKGSEYVLAELAFLEVCPQLLGFDVLTLVYHRDWPVYENYIAGKYDGIKKDHLGFEKLVFNDVDSKTK